MVTEREINDGNISLMVEERKELEAHVSHQRKVLAEKKKEKTFYYNIIFLQPHTMGVG